MARGIIKKEGYKMILRNLNDTDIDWEYAEEENDYENFCALSGMPKNDRIEFYSDQQITEWFNQYVNSNYDYIPKIPFGYYDLASELARRDNTKDFLE